MGDCWDEYYSEFRFFFWTLFFIFLDVFFKKSLKNEKIKTPKITNNFEINPKMMDVCIAFFGPFLKGYFLWYKIWRVYVEEMGERDNDFTKFRYFIFFICRYVFTQQSQKIWWWKVFLEIQIGNLPLLRSDGIHFWFDVITFWS